MKYIKDRQDDIIKLLNKRGENMTIEKLIKRNYQQSKMYEQYNKNFWLYVE
jgi:hypothetical protein